MLANVMPAENASGGVTTTTTSTKQDVSKRQVICVQFVTTGSCVFSIDGSNDGTAWTTGLACQDATSTASATFVTSKTISSAGNAAVYVPSGWRYIRCLATVTSGTNSAFLHAAG